MKTRFTLTPLALITLSLSGCGALQPSDSNHERLYGLFDSYQQELSTLDGSEFGLINDQMALAIQTLDRVYLGKLEEINRNALNDEEKVYYDIFRFDRKLGIQGAAFPNARFGNFDVPVTHFYNYLEWNAEEAGKKIEPKEGEERSLAELYQSQLDIVQEYTSWTRNLHTQYMQGAQEGIELPKVLIARFVDSSRDTIAANDYALLKHGLKDVQSHADLPAQLVTDYQQAVEQAQAATQSLLEYVAGAYMKTARGSGEKGQLTDTHIGWGDLPNGKNWYQWHLDRNSTTGKSAAELSAMGEQLVADAKAEMIRVAELVVSKRGSTVTADYRDPVTRKVAPRTFKLTHVNGNINLNEFFTFLNSEAFFYGRDGANITGTQYEETCKAASNPSACEAALGDYYLFKDNANQVVGQYFKAIKTDYRIEPSPAGREKYDGVASYDDNVFTLNTHPDYSLQKWNVSTLLLHEAAPGHHFQNAYALEYPPENKPAYIEDVWYTAYGEGWALYTEWLGNEMGIYGELDAHGRPTFKQGTGMCLESNDYHTFQGGIYMDAEECNALQYFGSLNEAQLRNMRLAVDTGIHAKGWSIQQARDYMKANSALGEGDIESESYRYAAHVGQAVSYKSGYLVIKEMLHKAQQELGDDFDYAEFHDQLLKYGQQPMEVVRENVSNWIASKQS